MMIDELAKDPVAFDFFHAVRLLQAQHRDLPRIGNSQLPSQDPVRFCQRPFLHFAPSAIDRFQERKGEIPPKLFVYFQGMFGPNGPLPHWLTEYAMDRVQRHDDHGLVDFVNMLHHRLFSLFFKAWAIHQKAVDIDRDERGRFSHYVGAFFGIGMESCRNRDSVHDEAKLFFAGRLVAEARNAEGLEAILAGYFGVPAAVETFVGHWLRLPPESTVRLGRSRSAGELGRNLILGSRVWDRRLRFRVQFGPLTLQQYLRFLPQGQAFRRLEDWILNYVGLAFFWDLRLTIKKEEVPQVTLGRFGQLGWSTWLASRPFVENAEVTFKAA